MPGTAIWEAALDEGDGVARASSERGRPMPGLAGIVIAPPVCEPASSKSSHDLEVALCPERALDRGHPTANAASKGCARPMPLVVVTVPVMHERISIECDDLKVALRAEVALEEGNCCNRARSKVAGSVPYTAGHAVVAPPMGQATSGNRSDELEIAVRVDRASPEGVLDQGWRATYP